MTKNATASLMKWLALSAVAIVIVVLAAVMANREYQQSRSLLESAKVFFLVGMLLSVLVLAPFGIWRNQRIDEKRKRDIRRTSRKLDLSLERFHLLTLGRFPLLDNLKHGKSDDFALAAFDYQYVIQGKSSVVVCQTVVWLRRRGAKLPDFVIRPAAGSWVNKDVLELFTGGGDINFKSHPTFSSQYLLRGHDEEAIRNLFTDDVLNFFEQTSGLIVEVAANKLLCYRSGINVYPLDRRSFVNEALQLLSLLQPGLRILKNPFDKPSDGLDRVEDDEPKRKTGSLDLPVPSDAGQPRRLSLGDRFGLFIAGLFMLLISGSGVVAILAPLFREGMPRGWGANLIALLLLPFWLLGVGGAWFSLLLLRSSIFPHKEPDLRTEPGAPPFSADSLVCQWSPLGSTLAVIVDHAAGEIHFKRCHRPHVRQRFWMIRPQAWMSCPLSDVLRTRRENSGRSTQNLIIETRTGTASVSSFVSNYKALCEYFSENQRR